MASVTGSSYGSHAGYIAQRARAAAKAAREAEEAKKNQEAENAEQAGKNDKTEGRGGTRRNRNAQDSGSAASAVAEDVDETKGATTADETDGGGETADAGETGNSTPTGETKDTDTSTSEEDDLAAAVKAAEEAEKAAEEAKKAEEAKAAEEAKKAEEAKAAEEKKAAFEAYKKDFLQSVKLIISKPHLAHTSFSVDITDQGYTKMMEDPAYEKKVLDQLQQKLGNSLAYPPSGATISVNGTTENIAVDYSGGSQAQSRSSLLRGVRNGSLDSMHEQVMSVIERRISGAGSKFDANALKAVQQMRANSYIDLFGTLDTKA